MSISRPVRWMIGSAIPAVLSFGGLYAADRVFADPIRPVIIVLATVAWLSLVTLWVSFLCWVGWKVFPVDRGGPVN